MQLSDVAELPAVHDHSSAAPRMKELSGRALVVTRWCPNRDQAGVEHRLHCVKSLAPSVGTCAGRGDCTQPERLVGLSCLVINRGEECACDLVRAKVCASPVAIERDDS